ncbi:hypothetical protein BDR03DRAFT_685019 [Suillus americanus]|nr:hypothetical protein BDR03DRAFT_685019 [Suillus americanus]
MNNNTARFDLLTLNSFTLSSTGNTPFVLNGAFAASSSTDTLQAPSSQYGALTFGAPAEQEEASRPRRDLRKQRRRLKTSRALQQEAFQRVQSYLQNQEDRKAYPAGVYALPNLTAPGPSNAMYGMVNAEFSAGYGPPEPHGPILNVRSQPCSKTLRAGRCCTSRFTHARACAPTA